MSQFVITDVLATEVAALMIMGKGEQTIAKILSDKLGQPYTWRNIKRVMESRECKSILSDLSASALTAAKTSIRQQVALLVPEIVDTLKHHLDKRNLQAIAPALKVLGFEAEEKAQANSQIIVQLPGALPEKEVVNVESEQLEHNRNDN